MMTLVVGGAGSGKSAYAEKLLILRSGALHRIYLATMEPFGEEAAARIAKHRSMRRDSGFETVECYTDLSRAALPHGCAVLLEDVGNLCANELFSPRGAGEKAGESVIAGIGALQERCRELIIVSNEVFTGGANYEKETLKYLSLLSYVNRELAAMADAVCEVSCGIAEYYKGEQTR